MKSRTSWSLMCIALCLSCSHKREAEVPQNGSVACTNPLTDREVTLDPDEVHDLVEAHYPTLRLCYEQSLDLDPSLQGKIDINLFVNESGTPTQVCSAGSTLPNEQVVKCVVHVFSQFRFAQRSEAVASVYPVTFSPY